MQDDVEAVGEFISLVVDRNASIVRSSARTGAERDRADGGTVPARGSKQLPRIRSRSDVPVILFTAHGTVQSAASAFKAGADDFISSPDVGLDDLVAMVARAAEGASFLMAEGRPSFAARSISLKDCSASPGSPRSDKA